MSTLDWLADHFTPSCDWPQLWGSWNWQTFRFIHASVEVDSLLGQFVLEAAALGFGLRFTWIFDDDAEVRMMARNPNLLDGAKCWIPYLEWQATQEKADAYDKLQAGGQ